MTSLKLYSELADIYDQLYLHLFNYKQDAEFAARIFNKYNVRDLLELGCGTGHLTRFLGDLGFRITGIDLFEEMLAIARQRNPDMDFFQQDMRDLKLERKFDCVFSMGRVFAYMTSNEDVENCFNSVANCLNADGIFLFDNFFAPHFIKNLKENKEITTEVELKDRTIRRISKNSWNLKDGVTFNWNATYQIETAGDVKEFHDDSILRTFFPEEIKSFLERQNFIVMDVFEDLAAFTILARKVG